VTADERRSRMQDDRDDRTYKVVVNGQGQYSIWDESRENPAGWSDAGKAGSKEECLAYVEEVWTDLTPLSARQAR
jgi:MbtH protein